MTRRWRIWLFVSGLILLSPVISTLMLQLQPVQDYLRTEASRYVTGRTGMNTTIGKVKVLLPNYLRVEDVVVYDHQQMLMLKSERLSVLFTQLSLKSSIVNIDQLGLAGFYLHQKKYAGDTTDNLSLFIKRLSGQKKPESETDKQAPIITAGKVVVKNGEYRYESDEKTENKTGIDFKNLHLFDLNLHCSNIFIQEDVVNLRIQRLAFEEKSGFQLKRFHALTNISSTSIRLRDLQLVTNHSAIAMDLSFHYRDINEFNDFVNNIYIRSSFGVTTLSTHDLGFFVPVFYATTNRINLKGGLTGYIRSFETNNFQFSIGGTSFDGDISMRGLPDFASTDIRLSINHLVADMADVNRFRYNSGGLQKNLELPEPVMNMGVVSVAGAFNGTYRDFYTDASFTGSFGALKADMQLSHDGPDFQMDGSLGVTNLDIGELLRYEDLGILNMDAAINGIGSVESWDFDIEGMLHSIEFRGYNYRNMTVNGELIDRMFSGIVGIEDENIALDFNGILDFNGTLPTYNFEADVRNANLANLGIVNDTVRGLFSSAFTIDLQGNHPDNLAGLVKVEQAGFISPIRSYDLNQLDISIFSSPENRRKFIAIRSDIVNGDIHGNFNLSEIGGAMEAFAGHFVAAFNYDEPLSSITDFPEQQNDLHFDFSFGDIAYLMELLTGERIVADKLKVAGSFQYPEKKLMVNGTAASLGMDGRSLKDWYLGIQTQGDQLQVQTGADQLILSDTMELYHTRWEGTISNNQIRNTLQWHFTPDGHVPDASITSRINLMAYPAVSLNISEGFIHLDDLLWQIQEESMVAWQENILQFRNFRIYNNQQQVLVNGIASEDPAQSIVAEFTEMNLSWIDFLTLPHGIDLDGTVSGKATLRSLWSNPQIAANLLLTDFALNKDPMGTVELESVWVEQQKGMKIRADFIYQGNVGTRKTAEIEGFIFPKALNGKNFALKADLDNFRINFLSNFLSDITSDIRGFAGGVIHLDGSFQEPELTGRLRVNARNLFVDYLNTRYSFSDSIILRRDAIVFSQIDLSDNNRINSRDPYAAKLDGEIRHRGFRDFFLDLTLTMQNFTLLNTNGQQDPMYFGRAIATGNVSIRGPVNDILINIQARTDRNTQLEIPLESASKVSRGSFITFRPPPDVDHESQQPIEQQVARKSNLRLNFDLTVTPDATIRLIFDPLTGDVIEGSGSGNLQMHIGSSGDFELKGIYTIAKGDYIFNLESFISKRFTVKSGSTIRWTGDPYDASIDIEAVYPVRASLAPINPEDSARALQSVDCVIHMTEKLFNPKIDFRVDFPNMTSFENERYQAIIRPNLNYHFVSLLAIGRFVNTHSVQFADAGGSANIAGTSTTEMLVNQLSVWFSNISDEFDVDFAYHPRSDLTNEQVEAIFRTQVLNDRLTIESKVGIGGGAQANVNQAGSNNMVGDITAEYMIDPDGRFRVKAYRKHNDQHVIYEGVHYTQGLGVFYRKEFESLRDLFRKSTNTMNEMELRGGKAQ